MSALLKQPMSLEAFLEWNSQQEGWYEFDGVEPVPMNGGSVGHGLIQANLGGLLFNALRGTDCRHFGAGTGIRAGNSVRYPDAFVVCSDTPDGEKIVNDPVVVFEVLSPTTASIDHIDKNREYRDTQSIKRYVILEQDRVAAFMFERQGDDWIGHVLIGDTDLVLPEVGVTLRLMDLYCGTSLAAA